MWQKEAKAERCIDRAELMFLFCSMAKQSGEYRFIGSVDGLCFYKVQDDYFVRLKSSLSGKRFWKDAAFEGSRRSCKRFGEGNRLASKVYQMIEDDKRVYRLYCFLKRRAILLLKEGVSVDEAEKVLKDYLAAFGHIEIEAGGKEENTIRRAVPCKKERGMIAGEVTTDFPVSHSLPVLCDGPVWNTS